MQVARFLLLSGVTAVLGACSSDSSSSAGAASTGNAATADTSAIVVQVDSTKSTPRPIPENVRSTEYAAPPRKVTPPAEE